jgi:hypothetical protein
MDNKPNAGDHRVAKYANKPRRGVFTKTYGKLISDGVNNWQPNAMKAAKVAIAGWGQYIASIGTYQGHMPSIGLATDIMVGDMNYSNCTSPHIQKFWDMAYFFQMYYRQFGIDYIIFRDRIWSHAGDGPSVPKKFTRVDNRNNGDCTNHHGDHIHISYKPGNAGGVPHRPIPPHLLQKRKPKAISVKFNWGDDQGGKNSSSDKNSPTYTTKARDLSKQGNLKNDEYIWAIIRSWGFTEAAAAGILGNLRQEAGEKLDPNQSQLGGGPGRGLAQWSAGGRWDSDPLNCVDYCRKNKLNPRSIEGQMAFIRAEMRAHWPPMYKKFKSITDIDQATDRFCDDFENPGDPQLTTRRKYAQQYYSKHKGSTYHVIRTKDGTTGEAEPAPEEFTISILPAGAHVMAVLAPTDLGSVAFLPPEPGEDDGGIDALTDIDD